MKVLFPMGSDNVGDELNGWLWPSLLDDLPEHEGTVLLGIGTLLNKTFCSRLQGVARINVLGTGAGYGALPQRDERWHLYAVRGPRTARAMGLPDTYAVADAAYLLATLDWASWKSAEGKTVVIPHHRSLRLVDWQFICDQAGLTFLSPTLPAEVFMRELASSRLVLTEAMHGAILADIVRIPWVAFSFGGQFNADKWYDWTEAFDLPLALTELPGFYDPTFQGGKRGPLHHLGQWLKVRACNFGLGKGKWRSLTPPGWPLEMHARELVGALRTLAQGSGQLTEKRVFEARVARLYELVGQLRREHGGDERGPLTGDPQSFFGRQGVSR